MNQLDYQPGFPTGSFFHNQALPQLYGAGGQTAQQQQGGQQPQQQQAQGGYPAQLRHQQQQQQQAALQHNQQLQQSQQDGMYSAAQSNAQFNATPYSQSIQSGPISPSAQQQAALRQSASPSQPNSPFATGAPQQQQQQHVKYPMAAPPLPHTPINTQHLTNAGSSSAPGTPQSPRSVVIEQSRIKLLLEINAELIEEICSLQEQQKGGATNPAHQAQLRQANMDDRMASEEYIQTLRRVQANLGYLAPRGNINTGQPPQKQLSGPAHMTPPPSMPQLQPKYDKLRELFPGWVGLDLLQQQQQQQAQRNATTAAGVMSGNMNGTPA